MNTAITAPPATPTASRGQRLRQQLLLRADSLPTLAALLIGEDAPGHAALAYAARKESYGADGGLVWPT